MDVRAYCTLYEVIVGLKLQGYVLILVFKIRFACGANYVSAFKFDNIDSYKRITFRMLSLNALLLCVLETRAVQLISAW